jgi:hypothetical protein
LRAVANPGAVGLEDLFERVRAGEWAP